MSLDTQWFHCQCRLGMVRIGVVVGEEYLANLSGPLAVMRQAALLGEVELVLQAIELWQELDLDLAPENAVLPGMSNGDDERIEIEFRHASMAEYFPVRLQVPISSVAQLNASDAELARSLAITWPQIDAQLVLDRVMLPQQESELLEHGAMMLLPRSFENAWQVNLVVPTLGDKEFLGSVQLQSAQITFSGKSVQRPAPDQADHVEVEVRLQQTLALALDTLLGDNTGKTVDFGFDPAAAATAQAVHGEQLIAQGSVAPVAAGYVLYLDQVSATPASL